MASVCSPFLLKMLLLPLLLAAPLLQAAAAAFVALLQQPLLLLRSLISHGQQGRGLLLPLIPAMAVGVFSSGCFDKTEGMEGRFKGQREM